MLSGMYSEDERPVYTILQIYEPMIAYDNKKQNDCLFFYISRVVYQESNQKI